MNGKIAGHGCNAASTGSRPRGRWTWAVLWIAILVMTVSGTVSAAETTTYVLTDAQGTVLAREDAHGTTLGEYDYRPYGTLQAGAALAAPGYTGHVMDPDVGLIYMQQRYYDPVCGCFLSVDPVTVYEGKDWRLFNRYIYAFNNPYRFTDPDGRCANLCTAAVGAGIGALVGFTVEGYSQIKNGRFDGRSLLVETGKGAAVGGLIGLTGGAAAASGMTLGAQAATTGAVAFGVGTGAHAVGEVAKGKEAPSIGESIKVGAATAVGAIAGTAVGPVTAKLTTTITPAVSAYPVTSLSGKVFNTVNIPAQTVTRPISAEVLNNAASAVVEDRVKDVGR
ncbi:RHS repeat-associated core domain-containing protein [Frateuria sp. Soil773]|uniref:RHS repeat-associated core domain-containing protein n=1 Tax=Frateuria sp. Soil773 TaxID=1736407 RepID=UPI001F37AE0B|nr:RHS repeat-associated core domain-containing protein [Frateuria sp. Soil773]